MCSLESVSLVSRVLLVIVKNNPLTEHLIIAMLI